MSGASQSFGIPNWPPNIAAKNIKSVQSFVNEGFSAASVQQLDNAGGAVDVVNLFTTIDTSGAGAPVAYTLADGVEGQVKKLVCVAYGDDGVVTPANFASGTTVTFTAVGQAVDLAFIAGNWYVTSVLGATVA